MANGNTSLTGHVHNGCAIVGRELAQNGSIGLVRAELYLSLEPMLSLTLTTIEARARLNLILRGKEKERERDARVITLIISHNSFVISSRVDMLSFSYTFFFSLFLLLSLQTHEHNVKNESGFQEKLSSGRNCF